MQISMTGGGMNGYNFTERVRRALQLAREEAIELRHEYVGSEHILLGLCQEGEGVAAAAIRNLDRDLEEIRTAVLDIIKRGTTPVAGPDLPYTSRAKRVLELSMTEARELNHSYVGTEHLLLGLIREERGIAAQVLVSMGLTAEKVRAEVLRLLHGETSGPKPSLPHAERKAAITLVVEHPDGRIEARKFRRTGDAMTFLKELEY
jgi:ATP-dependent Clp protease ATP-binding subunit ClpC